MYSKKMSRENSGEEYVITPPPGYDGSRFRTRSDGRDDAFPPYSSDIGERLYPSYSAREDEPEKCPDCECGEKNGECRTSTPAFFKKGIGQEELLLIALIIILATERSNCTDLILMLALLLCL